MGTGSMMSQSQSQIQYVFKDSPGSEAYLARYASSIFWLGRYLERAENLARLLDITHTFTPAAQGAQNWQSVIAIHSDEGAFASRYPELTAANAIRFYLSDTTHSNSILSSLSAARSNASQLRAVISTEMWVQINVMYNALVDITSKPVEPRELTHILSRVRRECQTHHGISEGGMYRDQGWYFYLLGKQIERADQITRLLDIKYHLLLPSAALVGSTIDAAQWFAVLHSAGAYHAFRRENPYVINPSTVAGFLLLDRRFPRSVACCLQAIGEALSQLDKDYALARADQIGAFNEQLRQKLKYDSIEGIIGAGLHEYLDQIQAHLIELTNQIGGNFFN